MGMFDTFRPRDELACPACGAPLRLWQGKDGPCALFVWSEGAAHPVDQDVDQELGDSVHSVHLPDRFTIYSYDCPLHRPIDAECRADGGVWIETRLLTFQPR